MRCPFYWTRSVPKPTARFMSGISDGLSPTEIRVLSDKRALRVSWRDGLEGLLPVHFLRKRSNSPSAANVHQQASSKKRPLPYNLRLLKLEPVGNYAVNIEFDDLHGSGIYSWELLRSLAQEVNTLKGTSSVSTSRTVVTQNGKFSILDWGQCDTQRGNLLLLHGFNQTGHSWDEFAPRVSQHYRVFAVDLRGHGESFQIGTDSGDYSENTLMEDVKQIIDECSFTPTTIMGMSMGGLITLRLASTYPNICSRICIVDYSPNPENDGLEQILRLLDMEWDSLDECAAAMVALNPTRTLEQVKSRLIHSQMRLPNGKWGWRVAGPLWKRHLEQFRNSSGVEAHWNIIRSVRVPSLLIRGEGTAHIQRSPILTKETANRILSELPNSKLVEVENAGHSVPGDSPEGFYQAVREFLDITPDF